MSSMRADAVLTVSGFRTVSLSLRPLSARATPGGTSRTGPARSTAIVRERSEVRMVACLLESGGKSLALAVGLHGRLDAVESGKKGAVHVVVLRQLDELADRAFAVRVGVDALPRVGVHLDL